MRSFLRWFTRLVLNFFYDIKIVNYEQIEALKGKGPTLVIPNHVSFMDAALMYALMPKDTYFVVYTTFVNKFNWFFKLSCNFVSVDQRSPYAMKKIMAKLNENHTVVIFPEGRLTTTGSFMKGYGGVIWLASKSQANILPMVTIGMEQNKFTRVTEMYKTRWFHDIMLYVGEPFKLPEMKNTEITKKKRFYADKIIDNMQKLKVLARMEKAGKEVNLFNSLLDSAKTHGRNKIILRDAMGAELSYKKLVLSSRVLGGKLGQLLSGEEKVGLMLPNAAAHPVAMFGLFAEGKTIAMINFTAGIASNISCAKNAGIKTIITSRAFIEKAKLENLETALQELCRIIYLEDVKEALTLADKLNGAWKSFSCKRAPYVPNQRVILFTSGSESKPKGVVLTHTNLLVNVFQGMAVFDMTPRDNMLNALPLFHSFGIMAGELLPILEGMMLMLYPSPLHYKEIPEMCYEWNISILLGTSTFLNGYGLYAHSYDFQAIKYVIAGAEKLTDATRYLWLDKFGVRISEGYGMTEASPLVSGNTKLFYKIGSAGKLMPCIDYKLEPVEGVEAQSPDEEVGVLTIKGPNIMEGYLIEDKGFVPLEGYYDTGDVVAIDNERFISIRSRVKRFAKVSGEMISLDAVEKAFSTCFDLAPTAAVNVQDEKRGEKIIVFTTAKAVDRKILREYWQQNGISMLSIPERIVEVNELPLLGTGKTDYVTIKELAGKIE
ncbi:MAG: AMP-binding protein [Negativicutes bacterium]|jgi:acyl-[acyl-carrier-protein]-phospholipid O-acyltransferase/long-chain-fatty-acid--[acyl-carrier-protein] ligase